MTRSFYFLSILILLFTKFSYAQDWSKLGTGSSALGAYGDIYTMCADNHGNIYVGGLFPDDSTFSASSIFKWNGSTWQELGHGSTALNPTDAGEITAVFADTNGNVYASAGFPDSTYVGYTEKYYVSKWDGASWHQLGTGSNALYAYGSIAAITMDKYGNIYAVGGFFEDTAGSQHGYVAKWDGTSWTEVGTGSHRLNANALINTILVDTFGYIYVAGAFTDSIADSAGNVYVAKWDGTSWNELGNGVSPQLYYDVQIFSIAADTSNNIYAAGYFLTDSGENVYKWDGTSWSQLGLGADALNVNNAVTSICMDLYGNIYAAGYFTDTTTSVMVPPSEYTVSPSYVAKWNGTSWNKLGTGANALDANSYILPICSDANGNIYAAGGFTDTTTIDVYYLPGDTVRFHPRCVAKYNNPLISGVSPLYKNQSIKIYPNPAVNELTVSAANQIGDLSIIDATGRVLYTNAATSQTAVINISRLPAGVYFIKINDSEVRRFVKE